jgi:hypothetical protein
LASKHNGIGTTIPRTREGEEEREKEKHGMMVAKVGRRCICSKRRKRKEKREKLIFPTEVGPQGLFDSFS